MKNIDLIIRNSKYYVIWTTWQKKKCCVFFYSVQLFWDWCSHYILVLE